MNKLYNNVSKEIMDDLTIGEAHPELILKKNIIDALKNICVSEENYSRSKRLNGGSANPRYKYELEGSLIYLWNMVKEMAKAKGIISRNSTKNEGTTIPKGSDYELMVKLEYHKRELTIDELLNLKNYLEFILHKINLTNLLIGASLDLEREMKEEY